MGVEVLRLDRRAGPGGDRSGGGDVDFVLDDSGPYRIAARPRACGFDFGGVYRHTRLVGSPDARRRGLYASLSAGDLARRGDVRLGPHAAVGGVSKIGKPLDPNSTRALDLPGCGNRDVAPPGHIDSMSACSDRSGHIDDPSPPPDALLPVDGIYPVSATGDDIHGGARGGELDSGLAVEDERRPRGGPVVRARQLHGERAGGVREGGGRAGKCSGRRVEDGRRARANIGGAALGARGRNLSLSLGHADAAEPDPAEEGGDPERQERERQRKRGTRPAKRRRVAGDRSGDLGEAPAAQKDVPGTRETPRPPVLSWGKLPRGGGRTVPGHEALQSRFGTPGAASFRRPHAISNTTPQESTTYSGPASSRV